MELIIQTLPSLIKISSPAAGRKVSCKSTNGHCYKGPATAYEPREKSLVHSAKEMNDVLVFEFTLTYSSSEKVAYISRTLE